MISKIRRILRLDSISDTLSKINNIDGELSELNSTIGDLALEYTNRNEAKKQLEKSEIGNDILKSVDERFGNYQKSHLDEVLVIKAKKDALEKERNKLMTDDTILKAYSELQSYNKFKKAYKQNTITSEVFNTFLKAKQGKVKYADNLVFNEKGELLIIQRAKTDKSNPEKWVLPGGHVDAGEDFKTAALRELNEEAGINVVECEKVGEYSDKNAQIEYYRSNVESTNQEVILETEESQDSVWINPHADLDKYEMVFNMKDNIRKILNIPKDNVSVIKKAIESGMFNQEAIDLLKSNKNYSKLIDELNKKRDPDSIEKNDTEDDQKEINHLKEMIEEHERLIKILAPHAKMDSKVKAELLIQTKELAEYKKKLKHEEKEVDLPEEIEKAINGGLLTDEAVELIKARAGVYANTAENRKKGRVGQKYGGKKEENVFENKRQSNQIQLGRSGKSITKTQTNARAVGKGIKSFLGQKNIDYGYNKAKTTNSSYFSFDKNNIDYEIRVSDHSKATYDAQQDDSGLDIRVYHDNSMSVDIDTSVGYKTDDVKNIISDIENNNGKDLTFNVTAQQVFDNQHGLGKLIENKIVDDKYGVKKQIALEQLGNIKQTDEFKKLVNEKKEKDKQAAKSFNEELKLSHGVKINLKKDGEHVSISVDFEDLGLFTKRGRKEVKERLSLYGMPTELKTGNISKEEYKGIAEKLIKEQRRHKLNLDKKIQKAIDLDIVDLEVENLLKARTGVYADNAQNRQLKRVGQKYGANGQPEQKPSKDGKQEEKPTEPKQKAPEELKEDAKNTSEPKLQEAIKNSDNPEVRKIAHDELKRRQDEEAPQEEKFGEPKKEDKPKEKEKESAKESDSDNKKEEAKPTKETSKESEDDSGSKNDLDTKEGIEAEIKRLRAIDTDDLDEITKISDDIQGLLKKRKSVLEKQSSERKVGFDEYRKGFNDHSELGAVELQKKYNSEANKTSGSKEEFDAINHYTMEGYSDIRLMLSDPKNFKSDYIPLDEGDPLNDEKKIKEKVKNSIKNLSSFIQKNKINESLSLNRNVKGDGKKFFQNLKEGDVYEDKSFSSTSARENTHFGDYNIEILVKKGSSVANVGNDAELEYTIDKDSKFRVLKTSDTGIIVELL